MLDALGVGCERVHAQTIQVLSQPNSLDKLARISPIDRMVRDLTPPATPRAAFVRVEPDIRSFIGQFPRSAAELNIYEPHLSSGELHPIISRRQEIDRITQILCRHTKNSLILIGETGVGKTAIVKGLAQRIVYGEVPQIIASKRLLALDLGILPGVLAKWDDEAEQQLQEILEKVCTSNGCILVLEDVSKLFGANTGKMRDAAQFFRQALSSGGLQCLGTCTPEAYEFMIKQDVAIQGWFEKVQVGDMTVEETIEVLRDVRKEFQRHYRLVISDEALKAAAEQASEYRPGYSLPGNAIALLDEAASQVSIQSMRLPPDLKKVRKGLELVQCEKKAAIQQGEYERAAELRNCEIQLQELITKLRIRWSS